MKTPIAFAAALSRQAVRTSPKLGLSGFVHHPSVPSVNVISPSPTREAGPFVWPAPPAVSASASASTSSSATGQRRQAVSFLARRTEQRDASLAPSRVSASPTLVSIEELSFGKENAQPLATEPVAFTSAPSATNATDAWPSLHFATCECETCDPPTSRTYATAASDPSSLSPSTSPPAPAPALAPPSSPRRIQPILRQRSTDDSAALRKKALRRVMQRKLKGKTISGSTTSTGSKSEFTVPTIMLNGSTVLVESAAAAKVRVDGEWHVRWLATEYLRRSQRYI